MLHTRISKVLITGCLMGSLVAQAAVSTQEAKKLSRELSPMGAQKAGNADGSIPQWTGSMSGLPRGLKYKGSGDAYPDPYKDEKPLFTVTKQNLPNHQNFLSEGLKALFTQYPDTFNMPVYPSHRDGRFSKLTERRTKWNASNTVLVNGIDGLRNYTGGAPFPIAKNAAEVMWNARIIHPSPTLMGSMDNVAVYSNGKQLNQRYRYVSQYPYSYPHNKIGDTESKIGINGALVHVTVERPERQRGQMALVKEPMDQVKTPRQAWAYIPGTRRVRRAPTVGFDTPDGPGGLATVDDALGYNGAMIKYNWKLVGKKEMYIPYHSYEFDREDIDFNQLLMVKHANPKYMRYEKHRVWVVEATLKKGQRHIYGKRRFYIDEDSWQIVLLESYDGRGKLWKVGILNTVYDYALKGYIARAQVFHDLSSAAYVAMRLVNETGQPNLMARPKDDGYYTPKKLRALGQR